MSGCKNPKCQHVNLHNYLLTILACCVSSGLKMADSATWSLRESPVVTKIDNKFSSHDADIAGPRRQSSRSSHRFHGLTASFETKLTACTFYTLPCRQLPSMYRQQVSLGASSFRLAGKR